MAGEFTFCVAPMMDWTDRHDRYFLRLISRHARLYTEMITANAVRFGDHAHLLGFHGAEHPVALQLGGNDAAHLGEAAAIGADYGYDEINLNVGCPSDRVQSGAFGASLMREPHVVAECVGAMRARVQVPISVKCRLGVDEQEPEQALFELVAACHSAGVDVFIIHARKAWLQGLSPKENRTIPPLDYELVYRLKRAYPHLTIIINGGIADLGEADAHLAHVDGVMLGRAAYKTPYVLADVDRRYFGAPTAPLSRHAIIEALIPYAENLVAQNVPLAALTRHLMGLYQGCTGGKQWRRYLGENAPRRLHDATILADALNVVRGYESIAS